MVIPMMPPTHECVVETGISRYDASKSQMPTARITHVMPHMSRPGLSSKQATSAMPLRIVLATCEPIVTAPRNSKIDARTTACRTVTDLAPTEVANVFATSFAPMPHAAKN